jgi:hypothetical protein
MTCIKFYTLCGAECGVIDVNVGGSCYRWVSMVSTGKLLGCTCIFLILEKQTFLTKFDQNPLQEVDVKRKLKKKIILGTRKGWYDMEVTYSLSTGKI